MGNSRFCDRPTDNMFCTREAIADDDDARNIDDVSDSINDDRDSCNTPVPISSRVPVVTMSDIDDYSRRNNVVVSNNPKRRKRKRKPGVKESKRKSIVANKRPRVGGRFVKNPK